MEVVADASGSEDMNGGGGTSVVISTDLSTQTSTLEGDLEERLLRWKDMSIESENLRSGLFMLVDP